MNPLVTIITPTTGHAKLGKAMESVANQTYQNIQHLVVIDGPEKLSDSLATLKDYPVRDLISLPYNTGANGYNGHKIYGACTFLAKGDYLMFLDEDNWIDSDHVQSLVDVIKEGNNWAYSLRKIVDRLDQFVCTDDCESLGKWKSILNDNFIDVGCWFVPKDIALMMSPFWYRRARHPDDQPEVDRIISSFLMGNNFKFDCTGKHTLNYRVGNRADSVQANFFLKGNALMHSQYNGKYPWRKAA